ncbi:META domain-containing protein [Fusobacterium massiliense]|uniref:META domain-containing protein n=1 Tax=Fusobacterium massiliense TaxID=1852365 RepID=UPI00093B1607|nr:META domain-containing protein [Fusobacterium massiliense]
MKKILILSTLVLALTACTTAEISDKISSLKSGVSKVTDTILPNLKQELNGREFKILGDEYNKEVSIGFEGDRFFGYSGINRYFGQYEINGGKLVIENMGTTKMDGKEQDMILELKFLTILKDNKSIKLEGDKLILISNEDFKLEFKDVNAKEEVQEIKRKK